MPRDAYAVARMNRRLVLAAVLAALALSSCGGDSETGKEPGRTRQRFIAQGDGLCRANALRADRQNLRAAAIYERAPDDKTALANLAPLLRKGLEDQRAADRSFARLTPPPRDTAQFQKMKEYSRDATALLSRLADAAGRRDVAAVRALTKEQQRLRKPTRAFLQGYGFKECGRATNDAD